MTMITAVLMLNFSTIGGKLLWRPSLGTMIHLADFFVSPRSAVEKLIQSDLWGPVYHPSENIKNAIPRCDSGGISFGIDGRVQACQPLEDMKMASLCCPIGTLPVGIDRWNQACHPSKHIKISILFSYLGTLSIGIDQWDSACHLLENTKMGIICCIISIRLIKQHLSCLPSTSEHQDGHPMLQH